MKTSKKKSRRPARPGVRLSPGDLAAIVGGRREQETIEICVGYSDNLLNA